MILSVLPWATWTPSSTYVYTVYIPISRAQLYSIADVCVCCAQDGDGILCQFIQVTDISLDETSGKYSKLCSPEPSEVIATLWIYLCCTCMYIE